MKSIIVIFLGAIVALIAITIALNYFTNLHISDTPEPSTYFAVNVYSSTNRKPLVATVTIQVSNTPPISKNTDSNGYVSFDHIPSGARGRITVEANGYKPREQEVDFGLGSIEVLLDPDVTLATTAIPEPTGASPIAKTSTYFDYSVYVQSGTGSMIKQAQVIKSYHLQLGTLMTMILSLLKPTLHTCANKLL